MTAPEQPKRGKGRPRIGDVPMTETERRAKSDDQKRERAEKRLTTWISAEAHHALMQITKGSEERGAIKAALETALTTYVRE